MAGMTITGVDKVVGAGKRMVDLMRSRLIDLRREIAVELTTALVKNIPVWSGRTIASLTWANQEVQNIKPHPQRGGYEFDSDHWWTSKEFGKTNSEPMGSENMRAGAEALAMAEAESVGQLFGPVAVLTINSVAWSAIENAAAPGGPGQKSRNTAVVSQIALAQVKSKFSGVLS